MANQYYQIPSGTGLFPSDVIAEGVACQSVASRQWMKDPIKVGIALSAGSCLVLLSIVAASAPNPAIQSTGAAESTNLIGLSPSLRSPLGGVATSGLPMMRSGAATAPLRTFGIPSSPLEKLAITAIKANQLDDQVRDVSMKAKITADLNELDGEAKEKLSEVEKAVTMKAQDMAGVTAPLGFFDPLGFTTDAPEGKLLFFRECEVKHGRVAMLASLGILVGEQFHPLFGGNINVPSYIAFQETPLQTFWPAVVAAIAIPEIQQIKTFDWPFSGPEAGYSIEKGWSIRSDRVSGDFDFDPLGLKPSNAKEFSEMQTKEINNGRLAMIAAAGMIAQEIATGNKIF